NRQRDKNSHDNPINQKNKNGSNLVVSVNISTRHFHIKGFVESIAELFNLIVSRFGEERIVTPNDIYHMLIIIQQLIDAWIKISFSPNIWEQTEKISLERFEGKKPANVLKVSIANYQMMLFLSNMPMEEILFPRGTVTPTQTYNFLSHLLDLVEKILIQKIRSSINVNTKVDGSHTTSCARNITTDGFDIHKLKIARPVTGKTPSDAYAITHRINQKLEFVQRSQKS
ncbi:MAG: hypothetical protein HQK62_10920, partial [Desulfamplus sp.]|nr:hypothetical protein [Desulfamplus sp.]